MVPLVVEQVQGAQVWVRGLAEQPVPATWTVQLGGGEPADGIHLEPRWRAEGEALVLGWVLTNTRSVPVALDGVQLVLRSADWPLLRDLGRLRMYQHGYQSWTPSAALRADSRPAFPLLRSFALMNHFVDSPLWGRRDGLLSSLLTVLQPAEGGDAVLLGYTTQRSGLGELFLRNRAEPCVIARLDYGGKVLVPGQRLEGEELRIARGAAEASLDDWATATGTAMGARVPASSPVGWCSWYEYYTAVRPEHLEHNADFLAARPGLGVGFVQLDDGYQPAVGDWLERNDKFALGLRDVTRNIAERGFRAGIWTAPFFAAAGSRLVAEHPDWLLQGRSGPVATGYNPVWRARTWALDLTRPDVLLWLGETFGTLVDEGFDYHKIDFLFAGLRHGRRHDPSCSPVEAYRQGLAAIREAIGPERFLLGCGAPLGPSVGFVDGMRVSQDVKEQWDSWLLGLVGAGCGYPSARGALRTNMTRWFLHRRLWVNDPDCLLVREHHTKLNEEETWTLVTLLGATGGMLFLSDDLPEVSEDRLALAAAVLPPSPLVGRPGATMASPWPEDMVVDGVEGQRLLVLVNWEAAAVVRTLPPTEDGSWFDFRRGVLHEERTVRIAPHGVCALRWVPVGGTVRILGDTLHLLAAVDGRLRVARDPEAGTSRLCCGPVARRRGRILLAHPVDIALEPASLPSWITVVSQEEGLTTLEVDQEAPWEADLHWCPAPRAATLAAGQSS